MDSFKVDEILEIQLMNYADYKLPVFYTFYHDNDVKLMLIGKELVRLRTNACFTVANIIS